MIRCYITDRKAIGGLPALLDCIQRNLALGVDWVQIREKDLPDRDLLDLIRQVVALARSHKTRVVVNSRMDIALAAAAGGLHLPGDAPPPSAFRSLAPAGFLIGVSCHDIAELLRAEAEGADYALYSPVFGKSSNLDQGETRPVLPLGLAGFAKGARSVSIPVFALGGVTFAHEDACRQAGAAGIAGISLFQSRYSAPNV